MVSIDSAHDLLTNISPNEDVPTEPFGLATVTNAIPLYVAWEGDIDDAGNSYYTPQAYACLDDYSPVVGDRVLMLHTGNTWTCLGSINGVHGMQCSRYTWGRTANGILTAGYDNFGTPSTTPWSTGSTTGGAQSMSRITITKACHIDLWAQCSGQANLRFVFYSNGVTPYEEHIPATSQGGGVYGAAIHWSGLVIPGELLDMNLRNSAAGTLNYVMKTFATFTDAVPVVAQT